jgi:glycosyltransferase involved in cell wall biosynthesis
MRTDFLERKKTKYVLNAGAIVLLLSFLKTIFTRLRVFFRTLLLSLRVGWRANRPEGLPVVIMEAMALCRPVISTYVAGIPELVCAGEHGWLVPAGDWKHWSSDAKMPSERR